MHRDDYRVVVLEDEEHCEGRHVINIFNWHCYTYARYSSAPLDTRSIDGQLRRCRAFATGAPLHTEVPC